MATIKTISPSTNKIVCEIPQATIDDARLVLRQSQNAFHYFKDTPFADRRTIVVKALALIQERKMILGRELSESALTMLIMREETFGLAIPVVKVYGDDEAIHLMNDTDYGLTASIWTKDIAKREELIDRLDAGTVFINRCDYPSPDLAWTGWKRSGLGCTLGPRGFDAFVKLKSYHVKPSQI